MEGSTLTGANGRALREYSARQKNSVQHFVTEATSTDDGVKYSLKTTYQPLPDVNLVWCFGWVELPLNAFVGNFSGNAMLTAFHFAMLSWSSLSTPIKLIPLSEQIMLGFPKREQNHSIPITHELASRHGPISKWTARVKKTNEEESQLFRSSSTNGAVKRSKAIKPGMCKGRSMACKFFDCKDDGLKIGFE